MNDLVLNKKESIERCIRQVQSYYRQAGKDPFEKDRMKQDAIAVNLQRACEQCIDLANHTIKIKKLGLPKESKESFKLLAEHDIIPQQMAVNLGKMVGFRNIVVHQYQQIDLSIMVDIIENHLDGLVDFTNAILKAVAD